MLVDWYYDYFFRTVVVTDPNLFSFEELWQDIVKHVRLTKKASLNLFEKSKSDPKRFVLILYGGYEKDIKKHAERFDIANEFLLALYEKFKDEPIRNFEKFETIDSEQDIDVEKAAKSEPGNIQDRNNEYTPPPDKGDALSVNTPLDSESISKETQTSLDSETSKKIDTTPVTDEGADIGSPPFDDNQIEKRYIIQQEFEQKSDWYFEEFFDGQKNEISYDPEQHIVAPRDSSEGHSTFQDQDGSSHNDFSHPAASDAVLNNDYRKRSIRTRMERCFRDKLYTPNETTCKKTFYANDYQ